MPTTITKTTKKTCRGCRGSFPATDRYFATYIAKGQRGLRGKCWDCYNEQKWSQVRAWREANPDKWQAIKTAYAPTQRELEREWQRANPEKRREVAREWARRNYATYGSFVVRQWAIDHPEKRREAFMRRHALKKATQVEPIDYGAILDKHGMTCHICKKAIRSLRQLHFDHIMPLSRGGPHIASNIAPAHARCNLRKSARLPDHDMTRSLAAS